MKEHKKGRGMSDGRWEVPVTEVTKTSPKGGMSRDVQEVRALWVSTQRWQHSRLGNSQCKGPEEGSGRIRKSEDAEGMSGDRG